MSRFPARLILFVLLTIGWLPPAPAATLIEYGFGTSAGTFSPTTVFPGVENLAGSRHGYASPTVFSSATGLPAYSLVLPAENATTTQAGAIADGDYFEFTVSAANFGEGLFLSSLSFNYGLGVATAFPTGTPFTASYFVRSSVDGFAANLGSTASITGSNPGGGFTAWAPTATVFDLSALSFQGIPEVTFRIYNFNTSTLSSAFARLDNVAVQGIIAAIPEPSTGLLLGLGLGLLLHKGRSRRKFTVSSL